MSEHFLQPLPFVISVSNTSRWDDETKGGKPFQPKNKAAMNNAAVYCFALFFHVSQPISHFSVILCQIIYIFC